MASFLDRIRRRARRKSEPEASEPPHVEPDPASIEAALAEAEELAARSTALARDLHRVLASGIARRRASRGTTRILH